MNNYHCSQTRTDLYMGLAFTGFSTGNLPFSGMCVAAEKNLFSFVPGRQSHRLHIRYVETRM